MTAETRVAAPDAAAAESAQKKVATFLRGLSDDEKRALLFILYGERSEVEGYGVLSGAVAPMPQYFQTFDCGSVINMCIAEYGGVTNSTTLGEIENCCQSRGCFYPI